MNKKDETFIGELKQYINSDAGDVQPPKRRKHHITRALGIGGGSIALWKGLVVFTVSAALITMVIGSFIVSMEISIPLEGRESYDLWVDNVPVGREDYLMTADTFTDDILTYGETEEFTHTFHSNEGNGDYDLYWDYDWMTWTTTPEDPFYGYNFSVFDELDNPVVNISVMSGETRTLTFRHYLHNEFADTELPLPFNQVMHVCEFVPAPVANDDTFVVSWRNPVIIYPLLNDEGEPLTIISVSGVPAGSTAVISPDGTYITYTHDSVNVEHFYYEITTGEPLYKSATAQITTTIS